VKYDEDYQSADVEDRRGQRAKGGRKGMKVGGAGAVIGIIVMLVFGKDYLGVMDQASTASSNTDAAAETVGPIADDPATKKLVAFISFAFDDIQETWIRKLGNEYSKAKLVLFTDNVETACGSQTSATGPFYCPPDHKAFIDLGFYAQLRERFGAPGDFAQAYVIAHEIGHHLQNLMGTNKKVAQLSRANPAKKNDYSIRQELQADCYAGVWAKSAEERGLLEAGDWEEGLTAAAAIGDDRLQSMGGGHVNPESWTHGSSKQRVKWFKIGMDTGDHRRCDTFSISRP
jgi:predicted metalloprotease